MGGPALPVMMQRAPSGRFSARSYWPPLASRAARRSAARRTPSAVRSGSRPVGGSTISDVRRFDVIVDWLRSSPNCVKS